MSNLSSFNPEQWVQKYSDALYAYTVVRVNDSGLAEDLVQETFLSAWKSRASYKGEASEKNWLYTICKNKIIDHYRKNANNIVRPAELNTSDNYFNEEDHWTKEAAPSDWGIDYNQPIETKEFYSILEFCKNKLQELQQSVFVMKFMEGLESDEICKVLNITASNYWVLVHRAKLQLRSCLEKNWINQA
ncbi:RNA polymerase sigma factor SigX [mine drainage metagenome]|uniref:RNA polymerase sigma factor SigX n=1 Tax=mine drainage metagenome TaxID=410659 RepID=A0A1J5SI99_9ZZZZ